LIDFAQPDPVFARDTIGLRAVHDRVRAPTEAICFTPDRMCSGPDAVGFRTGPDLFNPRCEWPHAGRAFAGTESERLGCQCDFSQSGGLAL